MRFSIILIFFTWTSAESSTQWSLKKRIQHIKNRMEALQKISANERKKLEAYIDFSSQSTCRSSIINYKVQCLLESSKKKCRKNKQCLRVTDILIVNKMAETDFISNRQRYKILEDAPKELRKTALAVALSYKYADLVARLSLYLSKKCRNFENSCFYSGLEQFCQARANAGKNAWQSCIGAIAAFASQQ